MAKVKPNGMLSGKIGNTVLRNCNGTVIASEKPDQVRNPRTLAQQTNRLKLRNIINLYGSMKDALKDNFQGKTGRQSDYSRFQACNMSQAAVYLTFRDNFASVVAPYVVSFGTLKMIDYHLEGEWLVTDIDAQGLDIDADTRLRQLTSVLLRSSELFISGDRIELIACNQTNVMDSPRTVCKYCEFVLDSNNDMLLDELLNGFEIAVNEDNKLCFSRAGACGLAMVRKRGEGRDASTSVQFLAVDNPLLEQYTSEEQKKIAIASYAKKK